MRVCSPHNEELDLSKLLVLQQQLAKKASWLLADPGTFKGTDVNFHQSQSWLQFCISLQGLGNDSSEPKSEIPFILGGSYLGPCSCEHTRGTACCPPGVGAERCRLAAGRGQSLSPSSQVPRLVQRGTAAEPSHLSLQEGFSRGPHTTVPHRSWVL